MLTPSEHDRLIKLLLMLGSTHTGERAAAAAMAHRLVQSSGLDWTDVIRLPDPPPYVPPPIDDREAERERERQRATFRNRDWTRDLSDAEIDVLIAVAQSDTPSERQLAVAAKVLKKIADLANMRRD